jgi:hypothetical protein
MRNTTRRSSERVWLGEPEDLLLGGTLPAPERLSVTVHPVALPGQPFPQAGDGAAQERQQDKKPKMPARQPGDERAEMFLQCV